MTPQERLREMLTYRRRAGTKGERKFINRFIRPLGVGEDEYGNLIKTVGENPRVLWSSHTDTVHNDGSRRQTIREDRHGIIKVEKSSCLGADNAAGVWMMIEMIRAGVPGLYIFHREEEWGGGGSDYIATKTPHILKGIDYAIAFDRRGSTSIITHQWDGRCCSDEFALALAAGLGMKHKLDSNGSYTDTANYTELIPECTNVSVGFLNEHTHYESLNTQYLERLLEAVKRLDVNALPVVRDPNLKTDDDWRYPYGEDQSVSGASNWNSYTYFNGRRLSPGEEDYNTCQYGDPYGDRYSSNYERLMNIIRYHPELVADYLDGMGVTASDLSTHVPDNEEEDEDEKFERYAA